MAKKTLTPVKAGYNSITEITYETASSTTDGFEFNLKGTDELTVILATNGNAAAKKITVKAPTKGSYAGATSDLVYSIPANGTAVIRLESARYANTDGTVVLIPETTDVTVAVIM